MKIGVLVINLYLEGCQSLKEKRGRLLGVKERIGKKLHVAICESDYQNEHQRAQWTVAALSTDGKVVDKTLQSLEREIEERVDARIGEVQRVNL